MQEIPRGLTQKNVNREVFKVLTENIDLSIQKSILDVPCGDGTFSQFLKQSFPTVQMTGVDINPEAANKNIQFFNMTAHEYFEKEKQIERDAVVCISGVMCFDGLPELFQSFHSTLKPGGTLVLTNDNILTVRDRLNFMFFGNFKRFKLLYAKNEGNWNVVLPQGLFMFFQRNQFKNIKVKYTAMYYEDLLFLPVGILIYPFFLAHLLLKKNHLSRKDRLQLFPFRSLYCRHYVISAQK